MKRKFKIEKREQVYYYINYIKKKKINKQINKLYANNISKTDVFVQNISVELCIKSE